MTLPWKTAWITGASTGIGRELALQLAGQGVRVAISARSADRLEALARENDNLVPLPLDVTERDAARDAHAAVLAKLGNIDLVVLNAGVWHPMKAREFDSARAISSMDVNYFGITNLLEPLIPDMVQRRAGQLALVASVAGYRGLPMAAAYAPSKAAVIALAEVLRLELSRHDVTVSLINPGFVDTPMTAVNTFPMPFKITPDDAARRIIRGLARGRFEIAFPWQLVLMLKALRVMPNALYLRIAARLGS